MKKPVFAMLLGGFLGVFDGLTRTDHRGPGDPGHDRGDRQRARPSRAWSRA